MEVEEITIKTIGDYVNPVYPVTDGVPTWMPYLDMGLFVSLLLLSIFFVWSPRRSGWLWIVQLIGLLWFGFYRQGCPCPVGSVGSVSLALFHPTYVLSLLVIMWFVLPILASFFVGRVFCGGLCPLGSLQDAVGFYPRRKRSILPPKVEKALSLGTWFVLGYILLAAYQFKSLPICEYDPFVAFFRMAATPAMWIYSGCFLVFCALVSRPFCRWLCPLGALLSLSSRVSRRKKIIDPDTCKHCKKCSRTCPMNCIVKGKIDFSRCILCGRCTKACRFGAPDGVKLP